ncbi:unnamed protein product [Echinostoma caproni]|uniref:Uncharacterized protein n=1 Tax=Echinostoma caproni TaxID=27848 RepID=A0A183B953_9TREM|nr:unnamed protein product [Echinostoma caproni]
MLAKHTLSASKGVSKQESPIDLWTTVGMPNYPHWPIEVQVIFEGFYDSEKEMDWITVDASVNLIFRFGWSWRHKACPSDTLISPHQTSVPLVCHHPSRGPDHSSSAVSSALSDCRFCPLDVIEQAKWITSGSRLSSGQLELRVTSVERRCPKRRDTIRTSNPSNSGFASTNSTTDRDHLMSDSTMSKNKQGLSGASYPVHYMTAPLPLSESVLYIAITEFTFLLLQVPLISFNHFSSLPVYTNCGWAWTTACLPSPRPQTRGGAPVPNGSGIENGSHETASTTDSLATSTSDFPLGTACSSDEVSSLTSQASGATSGRVEWRRVRFPRASDALDEYNRWPSLKFRVVWHGEATRSEPSEPTVPIPIRNGPLINEVKDSRASVVKCTLALHD